MTVKTKHFGEMAVAEDQFVTFADGLPAFEHLREFVILTAPNDDPDGYFFWLQSCEEPDVAFVLIDMTRYNPEYDPLVNESEIEELGEYDPETFRVYNIAVVPENVKLMTVNLKAPVVVNTRTRRGKQTICNNEEYTVRHFVFPQEE